MSTIPEIRIQRCNEAPLNADGEYVLYWMIAARRPRYNFGLQRAIELAVDHSAGLIVLEPLRSDYRWASERLHTIALEGMRANRQAFADTPVRYIPYIEREKGEGKGLLNALAKNAVAVVTDEYPCFFLPYMVEAVAEKLPVRLEQVDSNGLVPLRAPDREFTVAHSLRRWLQKELRPHLDDQPKEWPLQGHALRPASVRAEILQRWPEGIPDDLSALPIDHAVTSVNYPGGWEAARTHLDAWLDRGFRIYADERNHPDDGAGSGISGWLHWGHLSVYEVLRGVADAEGWDVSQLTGQTDGRRGWWGMGENGEAFMDEVVTWRELGYLWCHRHPEDYDRFDSLPDFARTTLKKHATDKREHVYTLSQFENAETHDEVWNAAQRQLLREGVIHNYLRMLWGKKILHWTESPEQALEIMIELNNKYAVDGRDPNSYSGIMWCLGRFDRAWGPERPVFGKVRYMTSKSTRRKCRMEDYLARYAGNT